MITRSEYIYSENYIPIRGTSESDFRNNAIYSFVRSFVRRRCVGDRKKKMYLCTYAKSVYELQANVSILIMNFKLKCFPNDYGE